MAIRAEGPLVPFCPGAWGASAERECDALFAARTQRIQGEHRRAEGHKAGKVEGPKPVGRFRMSMNDDSAGGPKPVEQAADGAAADEGNDAI